MPMKRIILIASLLAVCNAYAEQTVTFDFSDTMSLNPSINEPGLKSGVDLDGYMFTEGDVNIEFTASHLSNTSVRLYHSYDAGVDLRLYDGDVMTVTTTADAQYIKSIKFTMSLSGSASGSNDINFVPSTGTYNWAEEIWTPDDGSRDKSIDLVSAEQSRISKMIVTLEDISGIRDVAAASSADAAVYYNMLGKRVETAQLVPGVYIRVKGNESRKVVIGR